MDFFYTTELAVPVSQTVVLLMLVTISLLFGRVKLALLINYVFVLYWGYFYNQDLLLNNVEGINYFLVFYFGFGLLVAILAMIGFLFRND
ncbi:MAG: hypothetical protein KAV87_23005 [Desulfobacteraceae bacterium]|nr:hypothetical protein [Desulfobacteraceae bacterium]